MRHVTIFALALVSLLTLATPLALAATMEELRTAKEAEGYTVVPVSDWLFVGEVRGTDSVVRKYDVPTERNGNFFTGQIKVVDEGTAEETAEVLARLETPTATTRAPRSGGTPATTATAPHGPPRWMRGRGR